VTNRAAHWTRAPTSKYIRGVLLNEKRLRELYAAGEITIEEFEAGLDRINQRKLAAENRRPSPRATEPVPEDQRRRMLGRITETHRQHVAKFAAPRCPVCNSGLRAVTEHGVHTAWCPGCNAYRGPDPRHVIDQQPEPERTANVWIAGGIVIT